MPDGANQSEANATIVVLVVVYLILIAFSFYGSYQYTIWGKPDSLKDFAGLVVVCLTAASAVMGLVTGFVSLQRNQDAAIQLEAFKSDLQTKVLSQKIWTDLRFEHEKLKATAEGSAYAKLWTSIDSAYLLLAKLETGGWKTEDKTLMDSVLLEAHAQLVYTRNPAHQTLWEKARQRARFISEKAAKIDAAQQPELWRTNVEEFAALCREFKDIALVEINHPPPSEAASA
jgi:hypothetical protein